MFTTFEKSTTPKNSGREAPAEKRREGPEKKLPNRSFLLLENPEIKMADKVAMQWQKQVEKLGAKRLLASLDCCPPTQHIKKCFFRRFAPALWPLVRYGSAGLAGANEGKKQHLIKHHLKRAYMFIFPRCYFFRGQYSAPLKMLLRSNPLPKKILVLQKKKKNVQGLIWLEWEKR